jgi:CheY-like chemotaxis protein
MGQQTRIVLIDDDQDVCELLKMQLENTGRMSVSYNTNGNEAFAVITRELPDIAILDINMPGTHGVKIGSKLSEHTATATIPILYLSGMVTPNEAQDIGKGDDTPPLLSKSSPIEELIAAIDKLTTA